jgi:hypothetical protein
MRTYKRTGHVHQHLCIEAGRIMNASVRMMESFQHGMLTIARGVVSTAACSPALSNGYRPPRQRTVCAWPRWNRCTSRCGNYGLVLRGLWAVVVTRHVGVDAVHI